MDPLNRHLCQRNDQQMVFLIQGSQTPPTNTDKDIVRHSNENKNKHLEFREAI